MKNFNRIFVIHLCLTWITHLQGARPQEDFEHQRLEDISLEDYPKLINFTFNLSSIANGNKDLAETNVQFERSDSEIDQLSVYLFESNSTGPAPRVKTAVLYKTKDSRAILSVVKSTNKGYLLNGNFCLGSAMITFADGYFTLDEIQHSVVDVNRIKVTRCGDNFTSDLENTPSYKFPHQNHVSVNQRNKRHIKRHSRKGRMKRSSAETYTVELLIVVDHLAYAKWQEIFSGADNSTMLESIKQYYSYIFNGIDLRFGSIENQPFEINMAFADFLVAMNEEDSFWTSTSIIEDDTITSQRLMINASEALEKFQVWLDDESTSLPKHDHAILFTGGDLIYAGNVGNTGLAFAESMCRNISNSSIVEEAFDFRTVTYATRQIARSLGARDDMDNNDCLEFFNFIMAPKFKLPVKSFPTNRWKFSTCTVQYFTDYLAKIIEDGLNCLQETRLIDRYPAETIVLIQELPGTVYSAKKQCENVYGGTSDICRSELKPSDYDKLCTGLLCSIPGSDDCGYVLPADGTPCGNMKYCFEGQCLEFDDGGKTLDNCVFGDDPNQQCVENISNEPYLCYTESIRYSCCASCAKVEIGLSGCEYGDKNASCSIDICTSDAIEVKSVCCSTCAEGPVPTLPSIDELFGTTQTTDFNTFGTNLTVESTTETQSMFAETFTPTATASATEDTTTVLSSSTQSINDQNQTSAEVKTVANEFITGATPSTKSTKTEEAGSFATQTKGLTKGTSESPQTTSKPDITTDKFVATTMDLIIRTANSKPQASSMQSDINERTYIKTSTDQTTTPVIASSRPSSATSNALLSVPIEHTTHKKKVQLTEGVPCANTSRNRGPSATQTDRDVNQKRTTTSPSFNANQGRGCARMCNADVQRPSAAGQGFSVYDRVYFKQLARSMRQSQRKIRQHVQNAVKQLYLSITRQVRRHQESDTESYVYKDVVNPNVEVPSQDDDDINRILVPVWRRHHTLLLRNVERCVKQMRYKVLMMTNRHLRHQ